MSVEITEIKTGLFRASLEPHIAMVHEGVRKKCSICNKVSQEVVISIVLMVDVFQGIIGPQQAHENSPWNVSEEG